MPAARIVSIVIIMLVFRALAVAGGEIHEAVVAGDTDRVRELLKADPGLAMAPD
jgi:hypothetical protein